MKFNIPFSYKATFRCYKQRHFRIVYLRSSTMVDIVEVTTPAHPAFEVGHGRDRRTGDRTWERFRLFDRRPARVWMLGETYFAEYCAVADLNNQILIPYDNPFDASAEGGSALPFPKDTPTSSYEEVSSRKRIMEWKDDRGAHMADLIGRRTGEMRVIEGMVCVEVGEPVVAVEVGSRLVKVGLSELSNGSRNFSVPTGHGSSPRRYRLEDLDRALTYAKRKARGQGTEFHSDIVVGKAVPRTSDFCVEGEHLSQTIEDFLWTIQHRRFVLSRDDSACVLLKEVFAETPVDHVTGTLVHAAEAVLDKLRAVGKDDLPFAEFLRLFEIRRQLEEDIAAWQERAYSEHDFAMRALPIPAARWTISQILSRTALRQAAATLHVAPELLEREHELGNRLVRYAGKSLVVVVVTPALQVKCAYGRSGRIVELEDYVISYFLADNEARQVDDDDSDALSLAEMDFG